MGLINDAGKIFAEIPERRKTEENPRGEKILTESGEKTNEWVY
jgi:hypothetical protein